MKSLKKALSLLLIMTLILSLTACGKSRDKDTEKADAPSPEALSGNVQYGYGLQFLPLPGDLVGTYTQCTDGEVIYLSGQKSDGSLALGRYDGERFIEYALPQDMEYVHACCPADGGLAVLAGYSPWAYYEEGCTGPRDMWLLNFDDQGSLISRTDWTGACQRMKESISYASSEGSLTFSVENMAWCDGYYYLANSFAILQTDSQGQVLNILRFNSLNGMDVGPEGFYIGLYEYINGQDIMSVKRLTDPIAFTFEPVLSYDLAETNTDLRGFGFTPEGELLLSVGDAIVYAEGYPDDPRVLYSFYEEGIAENFFDIRGNPVRPWSGGYLLSQCSSELVCLKYGELHEKTPLILWSGHTEYNVLYAYVRRFNMTSRDYVVRVSPVKEDEAATAIAAGEGPDLYAFSGDGFFGYSETVLFERLNPYLESGGYSRDSFVRPLLDAINPGEDLYSLPLSFYLVSFPQDTSLLPDDGGSYTAAYALPQVQNETASVFPYSSYTGTLDLFPNGWTRDSLFNWLATVYIGEHINEAAGSCDFDTAQYAALLEDCAALRTNYAPQGAPSAYDYHNMSSLGFLSVFRDRYGDNYSLINAMGSAFCLSSAVAVSSGSANKEGAWAFLDFILSSPQPEGFAIFSALSSVMEDQLDLAASGKMAYAENILPRDVENFRQLLTSTHAVVDRHPDLMRILTEEAQRFFAGDRTARETAAATQSRASVLMAERFG